MSAYWCALRVVHVFYQVGDESTCETGGKFRSKAAAVVTAARRVDGVPVVVQRKERERETARENANVVGINMEKHVCCDYMV